MATKTALVLIDVQKGFWDPFWGRRNNPGAEENLALLLEAFRSAGAPVLHVQHASLEDRSPLRPDRPGHGFMALARPKPGEPVFAKSVNSAFIGTELEPALRAQGIGSVVLAGFTTDHCVSTSARMAANLGFRTTVVSDATATFGREGPDGTYYDADQVHALALASLHNEFASIQHTKGTLCKISDPSCS